MLRECDYHSVTVNHPLNFVSPLSGAHTQGIESLWSCAKVKIKKVKGTYPHMLISYLVRVEFLWRSKFGKEAFRYILEQLPALLAG